VLRVVNWAPQAQVTRVVTYSGWMSFFMGVLSQGRRVATQRARA
jgi:hypothetical protein